jgi:Na+-transporting methylmalonyl-CoA/oxaloacetate decarboxylase beta subunit
MDIGVIGGADGPTTIFVSSSIDFYTIITIAIIFIAVIGIIRTIRKRHNKYN